MYLETSDRRSLFHDRSLTEELLLQPRDGPQGLRRLRFSFFIFTCQTARERSMSPPFGWPKGRRSSSSDDCRMAFHCSSEELQRRVIAAKRGGRRRWVVYRGKLVPVSTEKIKDFATENPGTALLTGGGGASL